MVLGNDIEDGDNVVLVDVGGTVEGVGARNGISVNTDGVELAFHLYEPEESLTIKKLWPIILSPLFFIGQRRGLHIFSNILVNINDNDYHYLLLSRRKLWINKLNPL